VTKESLLFYDRTRKGEGGGRGEHNTLTFIQARKTTKTQSFFSGVFLFDTPSVVAEMGLLRFRLNKLKIELGAANFCPRKITDLLLGEEKNDGYFAFCRFSKQNKNKNSPEHELSPIPTNVV